MIDAQEHCEHDATGQVVDLPPISLRTALFCLGRLNGKASEITGRSTLRVGDNAENDVLSRERLIEIAGDHELEAKLIHLGWQELQASVRTQPVLLVLRNGNIVVAVANGTNRVEEIVVSDPLYCNGEDFFLPRDALEVAWGGIALVVKRFPTGPRRRAERAFSALGSCTVTAVIALLLLYPSEASNETASSNRKHLAEAITADHLTSSPITSAIIAGITTAGRQAAATVPESDGSETPLMSDWVGAAVSSMDAPKAPMTELKVNATTPSDPAFDHIQRPLTDAPKLSPPTEPAPKTMTPLAPASDARTNVSATILRGAPLRR